MRWTAPATSTQARAGGLAGYEVSVVPLDDESDSDVAVNNVAEGDAGMSIDPALVDEAEGDSRFIENWVE